SIPRCGAWRDGAYRHPRGRLHGRRAHGARHRQRALGGAVEHPARRPAAGGAARGTAASAAGPAAAAGGGALRRGGAAGGPRRRRPRGERGDLGRRGVRIASRGALYSPRGAGAVRVQGTHAQPRTHRDLVTAVMEATGLRIVTVGGPSKAMELARRVPTAVMYASPDARARSRWRRALGTPYYAITETADQRGLELCSALKNAYAIAVGLCDGLV